MEESRHRAPPLNDLPVFSSDVQMLEAAPTGVVKSLKNILVPQDNGNVLVYSVEENPIHPIIKGLIPAKEAVTCMMIVTMGDVKLMACGHEGSVSLWQTNPVAKGITIKVPGKVSSMVQCQQRLVFAIGNEIHLYNMALSNGQFNALGDVIFRGHPGRVLNVAVEKTMAFIISICDRNELNVWHVPSKTRILTQTLSPDFGPLIGFSQNEKYFAVGHRGGCIRAVVLMNPSSSGGKLEQLNVGVFNKDDPITAIKCNNNNLIFVGRQSGTIDVVDAQAKPSMRLLFSLPAHKQAVAAILVSSGLLYSVGLDKTMNVWAPVANKPTVQFNTTAHISRGNLPESELDQARDSSTASIEFAIDPNIRELDNLGRIIFQGDRMDVMGSVASVAAMRAFEESDRVHAQSIAVAKEILDLLSFHFIKDPNYVHNAQTFWTPSHLWQGEQKKHFLARLNSLCRAAILALKEDPILLHLPSPAYVLGDIHGSYKDLDYFARALWTLGVDFTPSKFIFLGDYVDRGPHSVEVIAYLLALKVAFPTQVFLLRGNHEFRDQNGRENLFSFRMRCHLAVNQHELSEEGEHLWDAFNSVFEWMPLAAIVDRKIFCCHGGIPRATEHRDDLLICISSLNRPLRDVDMNYDRLCLTLDLMWSDPAPPEAEATMNSLFAENRARGENVKIFGLEALDKFGQITGCTHLIRAHQPPQMGAQIAKNGKVLTVFSSSHYCGGYNSAAVVFINKKKVQIATTSHRQDDNQQKLNKQEFDA